MRRVPPGPIVTSLAAIVCAVTTYGVYLASAPPSTFSPAAAWLPWLVASAMSATVGLVMVASARLGLRWWWAASAALSFGLSWPMWMMAIVPGTKVLIPLFAGLGLLAIASWSATSRRVWPTVAVLSFAGATWVQVMSSLRVPVMLTAFATAFLANVGPLTSMMAFVGLLDLWWQARGAALGLSVWLMSSVVLHLAAGVSAEAAILTASPVLWALVASGFRWMTRVLPGRAGVGLAVCLATFMPVERWLTTQATIADAASPFFPGSLALSLAAIPVDGTLLSDDPHTTRQIARAASVLPISAFQIVESSTWRRSASRGDTFAFHPLRLELEEAGVGFITVPRRVPLSAALHALPAGDIVAIALTPVAAAAMPRGTADYFAGIGAALVDTTDPTLSYAVVGRARARSEAVVHQDRDASHADVQAGSRFGGRQSPIAIDVRADRNHAAIAIGGRELINVLHGGALVATSRDGLVYDAYVITPEQRLRIPVPADEWSLARVVRANPGDPLPDPFFSDPLDASAFVRFDGRDGPYFGRGWHLPERDGTIEYIWTSEARSTWRIPLATPMALRVMVELSPAIADDRDPPRIALHVNDVALEPYPARPGRHLYEWTVPEDAWRTGDNEVGIEVSRLAQSAGTNDQRMLGAAVSLFRLERVRR